VFAPEPGDAIDVVAALYARMSVVIAPSTGPLHVAAAVGTPVVGLYPNLRVQSPARWGPYVADPSRAAVLMPAVDCVADPHCMQAITVETVVERATSLSNRSIP
jgi:ADP-heptose:LPS heptosyltransferase